jgi:uncharacterized membrane protein
VQDGLVISDHLVLHPLIAPFWAVVIVIALAATMIVIARRRPAAASPRFRAVLLALRLAVVAAVGLLLLGPVVRWESRREVPGAVAVFLDASRSMAIADAAAPAAPNAAPLARAEAVRQAFLTAGPPYNDLARRYDLHVFAFGNAVRPIGHFAPEPTDPRTDIAQALRFALEEDEAGRVLDAARRSVFRSHLAAVILVSDGRANRARRSAEDAARQLAERGIPVHTVLAGSDVPTDRVRDVSVRDLRAPSRVFAGNRPQVRAVLATLGLKGVTVTYVLTIDGKESERRTFVPATNQTSEEIVFTPPLETPGLARLAVAAEAVPGELIPTNNRAETAVRVEEGAVRVLYLDGRIHPEGKYVARALGEAQEIDLDRRILVGPAGAPTAAEIDACDLVVLGDLPASALDPAVTVHIAQRVRAGSLNLLVLGGLSAYGAGGWAATPLAQVLPVAITPTDGQAPGPLAFRPAPDAASHFIFAGEGGTPMRFDALPPLAGANAVGPLEASARLLAQSADGRPLLAVREFGRARVAAFMADTTWQWALAPEETHGADIHRRFWRQLALWTAGRDGRPRADFWVATDRPRYVLADLDNPPVAGVTVHAPVDAGGRPPSLKFFEPQGEGKPVALASAGGGDWQALISLYAPGTYKLVAETGAGADARKAETPFVVEDHDFELAKPLADAVAMDRLAKSGGGTFRRIDALPALMTELAKSLKPQYEVASRSVSLVGGRVFLAVVLMLLTAEWFLRRKRGI